MGSSKNAKTLYVYKKEKVFYIKVQDITFTDIEKCEKSMECIKSREYISGNGIRISFTTNLQLSIIYCVDNDQFFEVQKKRMRTNIMLSFVKRMFFSKDPVKHARKMGVNIGDNCKILCDPRNVFGSEPYLITIGNSVEITYGVRFVTHDGGVWVLRNKYKDLDVFAPIRVGNNVFIGINSIILPGVNIGDNVVIGAGSVITRDVPSNSVIAGVPGKIIKSYNEYLKDSVVKGINTKSMPDNKKKEYIKKNKPEWCIK